MVKFTGGPIEDHETVPHRIDELVGNHLEGYYVEGFSEKLPELEGTAWFCFEVMDLGELIMELHDVLGFSIQQISDALEAHQTR